jgi:hypothetical protein
MVPSVWRFLCFLLVVLLIGQNILLWLAANKSLKRVYGLSLAAQESHSSNSPTPKSWSFNASEDANNFALTQQQCDSAFPDLYYEIDRAVVHRNDRSLPIEPPDVSISWRNDAAFRGLIHDNQLRILQTKGAVSNAGYRRRTLSVLNQINRAVLGATAAGQKLPSIEFAVTVDDMALLPNGNDSHAIWTFTRRIIDGDQHRLWMIPDMDYQAIFGASYTEMRARAAERESFLVDKVPKAVWRGVVWTNEWVRKPLMEATKDKKWADIEEVSWDEGAKDNMIPIEDYCRYAFIVHTEGRSWSGRLKHMLNCDSVPIVHDLDWTTWMYHLLHASGPGQNYLPVRRDYADLEKVVKKYTKDSMMRAAQAIADNAVVTFRDRYGTPAAEACYWRRLIRSWREVSFQPEVYHDVSVNVSGVPTVESRLRGIAFEEYILDPEEID